MKIMQDVAECEAREESTRLIETGMVPKSTELLQRGGEVYRLW